MISVGGNDYCRDARSGRPPAGGIFARMESRPDGLSLDWTHPGGGRPDRASLQWMKIVDENSG